MIEQLLGETASPTELCWLHHIYSGQLYTWKRQYAEGKLAGKPSREAELSSRIRELERLPGKVTLENEFLKKSCAEQPQETREKREFIAKNRAFVESVQRGCELMALPRRSYYCEHQEAPTEDALITRIGDICPGSMRGGLPGVSEDRSFRRGIAARPLGIGRAEGHCVKVVK